MPHIKTTRRYDLEFTAGEILAALRAAYPDDPHVQAMPASLQDFSKFGRRDDDKRVGTLCVQWEKPSEVLPKSRTPSTAMVKVDE